MPKHMCCLCSFPSYRTTPYRIPRVMVSICSKRGSEKDPLCRRCYCLLIRLVHRNTNFDAQITPSTRRIVEAMCRHYKIKRTDLYKLRRRRAQGTKGQQQQQQQQQQKQEQEQDQEPKTLVRMLPASKVHASKPDPPRHAPPIQAPAQPQFWVSTVFPDSGFTQFLWNQQRDFVANWKDIGMGHIIPFRFEAHVKRLALDVSMLLQRNPIPSMQMFATSLSV